MAETLGSLLDKLTVVELKRWHAEDATKQQSLDQQRARLAQEIDEFLDDAVEGRIPPERITFAANKVTGDEARDTRMAEGSLGVLFAELARTNCELWHLQEKVYEFETVPASEKDGVIKSLADLNLERCSYIDGIDRSLEESLG